MPYKDPERAKLSQSERSARYWAKHRDRLRAEKRVRYAANREKERAYHRNYEKMRRQDPAYVEAYNARLRRNHKRKRAELSAKEKERYHTDPIFRIKKLLRSRIRKALRFGKGAKSARTLDLLGCSVDYLRQHLESKFLEGMTWENYGKGAGKWSMDHIKPCAAFDLTDSEQQKVCFHFSNMQPLWDLDNIRKSDNEIS